MTRLLVGNSNGRSNGEPRNPAKRFAAKPKMSDTSSRVVTRSILLIWRRLPICLSVHLLFPSQGEQLSEKTQRKLLLLVF